MRFLRYPGGKSNMLAFLVKYLPSAEDIQGHYIEPFLGGGAIFLNIQPKKALLSDINPELIDLYKGIRLYPHKVWRIFESFPTGKDSYYEVRDREVNGSPLYYRAARTLYLNRTCFKGMWRHNSNGKFNVGYGGEGRRWAITHKNIIDLSLIFRKAEIRKTGFEETLSVVSPGDFIFLDPPYVPGEKSLNEAHYIHGSFTYDDQIKLSMILKHISKISNVKWLMTNSSHADIKNLYAEFKIKRIPTGTSSTIGVQTKKSKEILISNY